MANDLQWIKEVFDGGRELQFTAWGLKMTPDPAEVTGLTIPCDKDALLIRGSAAFEPLFKLPPNSAEFTSILDDL